MILKYANLLHFKALEKITHIVIFGLKKIPAGSPRLPTDA
jgi:hypothetical protein